MIKKYIPLIFSLVVLYSIVSILLIITLNKNDGTLTYPLDDTFIHMAISKNLAEHGVWGISRYEFSSTTSSPLYTLILALVYFFTGANLYAPLFLNLIFSSLFLLLIDYQLRKVNTQVVERLLILLAVILFMPLPILVITGMEHIMHALFTFWFVFLGLKMIIEEDVFDKNYSLLFILGALLGMSRYEGLFTVFALCCLFFLKRRFSYSFALGAFAFLPLLIYGIISVNQGSYWLPNSILLKGNMVSIFSMAGIESLYSKPLGNYAQASWLFTLTGLILSFFAIRSIKGPFPLWNFGQLLILVFLITLFFHLELAAVGWVYRYEAYLMAFGIFIVGILWRETTSIIAITFNRLNKFVLIGIFILLVIPIVGRGISALKFGPRASNNIYMQQYQMGRFLKEYYNEESVAANDIGAINFLADLKILDIVGLGSIEVAKAKQQRKFSGEWLENLAKEKDVRIAIVYDRELKNSPTLWTKVGEWEIENNVVGASEVVAFYAVNSEEVDVLRQNLKSFVSKLPHGVRVKIL